MIREELEFYIEYLEKSYEYYLNSEIYFEDVPIHISEDFDFLKTRKELAIKKLPIMIKYLETGIIPTEEFDKENKLGEMCGDSVILKIENSMIHKLDSIKHLKQKYNEYLKMEISYDSDSMAMKDEYDYLKKIRSVMIHKLPIMMEYLETGNLKDEEFDDLIKLGAMVYDPIISEVEKEVIKAYSLKK